MLRRGKEEMGQEAGMTVTLWQPEMVEDIEQEVETGSVGSFAETEARWIGLRQYRCELCIASRREFVVLI